MTIVCSLEDSFRCEVFGPDGIKEPAERTSDCGVVHVLKVEFFSFIVGSGPSFLWYFETQIPLLSFILFKLYVVICPSPIFWPLISVATLLYVLEMKTVVSKCTSGEI